MRLRPTAQFTNKAKRAFLITLCYTVLFFYQVNLTISRTGLAYNSRNYKGILHEDVTYQHPLFVNNPNNNHYFTNYLTNNRSVFTMIT